MNTYTVHDKDGHCVLTGDGRTVGEYFGITPKCVRAIIQKYTKSLYRGKYKIEILGRKETNVVEEDYLKTIKKHLDEFGNTIVTRMRLKKTSVEEIIAQLEKDGYHMKPPRKAYNYDNNRKKDYWVIEVVSR